METQWQPIETAPKDGTEVLVFEDGQISVESFDGDWWMGTEKGSCQAFCEPTHWMPLPNPPTSL